MSFREAEFFHVFTCKAFNTYSGLRLNSLPSPLSSGALDNHLYLCTEVSQKYTQKLTDLCLFKITNYNGTTTPPSVNAK